MTRIAPFLVVLALLGPGRVVAQSGPTDPDADAGVEAEADVGAVDGSPEAVADTESPPTGVEVAAPEVPPPPRAGEETSAPPAPSLPPPVASVSEADIARLDAWLSSFDGTSRILRRLAAPLGVLAGGALAGIGIWFAVDEEVSIGSREATLGLGAAVIAVGVMSIGVGIYNFAVATYPEELYERFTLARDGGLDARALGRFEGELLAAAELSRTARYVSIVAGLSLALGGGVAMGVSATEERDEPRLIGVSTGLGLTIVGAVLGGLSFIPSPYERAWEKYEAGVGPDDPAPSATISPVLAPDVLGVAATGRF